jgi:hypothetical protein
MSELIVVSPEHYFETLLRLIENPLRLQRLRLRLWKSTLIQYVYNVENTHALSRPSTW